MANNANSVCILFHHHDRDFHYNDVIMSAIASQITSLTIVFSTVYLDSDQRKYQSSASLAFVRGIHRKPVNSPHKWPVTRKMFSFDDVIMLCIVVPPSSYKPGPPSPILVVEQPPSASAMLGREAHRPRQHSVLDSYKAITATPSPLTQLPLDKMAPILADDNFECISWVKMIVFRLYWLGAEEATSHHLSQCWPSSLTHICGTRGRWMSVFS